MKVAIAGLLFSVGASFLLSPDWGAGELAAQERGRILFEDKLKNDLESGWSWVREEKAGHRIDGQALELKTLSGTLWGETNTAMNIFRKKGSGARRRSFC